MIEYVLRGARVPGSVGSVVRPSFAPGPGFAGAFRTVARRGASMVAEGFWLMGVGMFAVFAFLGLLVGVMHASAALFAGVEGLPAASRAASVVGAPSDDADRALLIAIAEAARRGRAPGAGAPGSDSSTGGPTA